MHILMRTRRIHLNLASLKLLDFEVEMFSIHSLFTAKKIKKWSFPLRISSVNVTKSAVSFIFCAVIIHVKRPGKVYTKKQ